MTGGSAGAAVRRVALLAHHLHEHHHLGAVERLAPHAVAADSPSTASGVVLVERQGSSGVVVVVRMNRPAALNALGTQARPHIFLVEMRVVPT